jgi:hypothetical protein
MFYLIEKISQLHHLKSLGDCFMEIVPLNSNYHPCVSSTIPSLIYLRPLNSHKGYIICMGHNESLCVPRVDVMKFINNETSKLFVLDKKLTCHKYMWSSNLYDINFIQKVEDVGLPKSYEIYYSKYPRLHNVNSLIPITKHYEYLENIFNAVKPIIDKFDPNDKTYQFNNGDLTNVFTEIESEGISLNRERFIEYYDKLETPEFNIKRSKIFTQYNLHTTTGRPSNSFNNINFAALDKSNGERNCFKASNDELIELDFDAYHPRLIAELVDYDFRGEPVYEHLSKIYNSTIEEAKELTFKQLYGGIKKEYLEHEFFSGVNQYIKDIWDHYEVCGNITFATRKFDFDPEMNPMKLFNYYIQGHETYTNTLILKSIINYLKPKKTKIILYTYDAFLIDFALEDGEETIEKIKRLMKYPVKIKRGQMYGGLVKN